MEKIDLEKIKIDISCIPSNPDYLYYLASPCSHKNKQIEYDRFIYIDAIATILLSSNIFTIEPIGSTYLKALKYKLPTDFNFWSQRCINQINHSDGIIVAMIPGWDISLGVTAEIEYAQKVNKPIYYLKVESI